MSGNSKQRRKQRRADPFAALKKEPTLTGDQLSIPVVYSMPRPRNFGERPPVTEEEANALIRKHVTFGQPDYSKITVTREQLEASKATR